MADAYECEVRRPHPYAEAVHDGFPDRQAGEEQGTASAELHRKPPRGHHPTETVRPGTPDPFHEEHVKGDQGAVSLCRASEMPVLRQDPMVQETEVAKESVPSLRR